MTRRMKTHALVAAVAAVSVVAVGGLTPAASAQGFIRVSSGGGPGGAGSATEPAVNRKSAAKYAAILGLSADQQIALDDMVQSYLNDHATALALMNQRLDDARAEAEESGAFESFIKEMSASRKRFSESMDLAEERLFDDLRLVLSPEQENQWPAMERTRRRIENIDRGVLSSESVDLIQLVDDIDPPDSARAAVAPVLAAYETTLDAALVERIAQQELMSKKMEESDGPTDWMRYRDHYDSMRKASLKVRDVNTSFARQIRDSLPTGLREQFEAEFQRRSFPQAYAGTYTERVVDTTLEFDDLTPDQRKQIEELRARLAREMEAANARWAEAQRADEDAPNTETIIAEQFGMPMEIRLGEEPKELKDARAKRSELASAYLDQVRALLSPEQQARLPRREPSQRGVGAGGGMRMMVLETTEDASDAPPPPGR